MYRQHLIGWIIGSALICAGLGAWAGQQLGDGRSGNIALISAAGAVVGSFLPEPSGGRARGGMHNPLRAGKKAPRRGTADGERILRCPVGALTSTW